MSASIIQQFQQQRTALFVLFCRELKTRFGRFQLGYAWAILEPLALILILSAVRIAFGRSDIAGLSFPVFFAGGILPYLFFAASVPTAMTAVESNMGLFNYRRATPFDAILVRVIVEAVIYGLAAVIILFGMHQAGIRFELSGRIPSVALTLLMLFAFALGLALIVGSLAPLFQELKKVVPIVMRPLFFISGLFFAADLMPEPARSWLLINPLLHMTELFRYHLFAGYESNGGSFAYFGLWSLAMLVIGLAVYRVNRIKLLTSGNIR